MHSKMNFHKGNKLLLVLAGILILAHAVIPHTHHFKFFSSIANLLGEDFKEQFEHHNPTTDNQAKESFCIVRFDFSKMENITGQVFKKTNPEKNYVLDYQLYCTVDNPPDIICEIALQLCHNQHVIFSHRDCIVSSIGLRAPPSFVKHVA